MRHLPSAALLLLLAACGSPPVTTEAPPEAPAPPPPDNSEAVLEKLRAGEAPTELRYDKNPLWTAEIGKALQEDRPWKSDADAFAAIVHFATHAGPDQIPIVEALLTDAKPERRMRGLLIARLSPASEMTDLLKRYAADLLDPKTPEVAKVALGAMSYRKVRGATEAILGYYEATEDKSAIRHLGRIWEGAGDDPMRTAVLVIAHAQTMGPEASPDSTDALLRIMTDAELGDYLAKWVPEKFSSRELVIAAAGEKGFDRARGRKIHEAFLKSPDPAVATTILWKSPHKLDAAAVNPLLDDERVGAEGAKVCHYAAARLESIESGLPPELPADEGLRERRLKKWRARR